MSAEPRLFRRSRRRIVAAILGVLVVLVAGMVALIYSTSYREVSSRNERMLEQYASVYWEHGLPGTDTPPSASDSWPANQPQSESSADGDSVRRSPQSGSTSGKETTQQSAPSTPSAEPPSSQQAPADLPATDTYTSQTFYAVVFDADGKVSDHAGNSSVGVTEDALATAGRSMAARHHVTWAHASADLSEPDAVASGSLGQWMYRIEQYDGRTLVVMMDNTVMDANMATLMRYTAVFGAVAFMLLAVAAHALARLILLPLERAHAEQRRFVADAGHELKTPVATIGVNTELLRRDAGDSPWLDNIEFENRRMGRLVAQLLELAHAEARAEAGTSHDDGMEPVDMSRLVSGCLLACEPVAFEHGLRFEDRIDERVLVRGDETRLGELASILFDNAIDHARLDASDGTTDSGTAGGASSDASTDAADDAADDAAIVAATDGALGVIRVTLHAERGRAILRVTNPGSLSSEQIAHLFDRFYRADAAHSGSGDHYGLGLSIARAIVAAHHGTISCTSEAGRVMFTVSMPAV
ncbi:HAMP domain-containing histidine kinase [Bifidobacterium sp. 82T10]|uniref:histidine kinase n=1 Tax=Bifidobacterium miconis TaxID=2834435 RepID=A0ABS6WD76_9BIFI|nr:HAMP domain-containing sensor histidine kinase [Bifidobacterium miconis]MBW3091988.1 HAMP domain-containing histidine kinase [Bifidobacterium miconis]